MAVPIKAILKSLNADNLLTIHPILIKFTDWFEKVILFRNTVFMNIAIPVNASISTSDTLWTNSADDRLMIFFLIFPRKQDLSFQIRKIFQYVS